MPRFDKTGPEGKGSKTGRGLGNCNEKESVESKANWPGWFSRRRPGRRRGFWNMSRHAENDEVE